MCQYLFNNQIIKLPIDMTDNSQGQYCIRYRSSPNIALVKYWGKYDEEEILPINDSIDDLSTITTCSFAKDTKNDQFWLNGKLIDIGGRMRKVLGKIKEAARKSKSFEHLSEEEWKQYHFQIKSENSFPTASGMASSASGFSCLATALNGLFGGILDEKELSRLARWGSGSAARAVYGGLVKWQGVQEHYLREKHAEGQQLEKLSKQCISYTIKQAQQLSYLKVIILLTENKEKQVSSTLGMKLSTETSDLIKLRNGIAKERIAKIQKVLAKIDEARGKGNKVQQSVLFGQLTQLIIRDSNQFHAICLDTYPPIFYLNDFSKSIISIVDNIINKETKKSKIAYSFDAGAHSFIFLHEQMLQQTLHYFNQTFELQEDALNLKAKTILSQPFVPSTQFSKFGGKIIKPTQMWVTDVGRGAEPIIEGK